MTDNEEEPTVTEGQVHLTDLADLAETDRMLDRIAARDAGVADADDDIAALLLALALDVDAAEMPTDPLPADPDLEALIAAWIADAHAPSDDVEAPADLESPADLDSSSLDLDVAPGVRPAVAARQRRHVARRPVRSYLPTALRLSAAAAVAVGALGIGSLVTGDSGPLPGVGGSSSLAPQDDPSARVAELIQQAKAAVKAGRPAEAVQLFKSACELVPQVNPEQRPALQQALTELRQVLVTVPGAPSAVPEVPGVAAGQTSAADTTPSPTPVQPTDSTDPATSAPETTSDPAVTTPDPTPTEVVTTPDPDPTDTEPTSTDSPTVTVEPQNTGVGGTSDGSTGDSVDPLASLGTSEASGDAAADDVQP